MQSFLQIIFAASICDLILTTLITYYRVFCIRHHSKNTLYLPLSLSDILLTAMIQYWPELSSPSLSVSFQWNYVGYVPRWLLRVHLLAFIHVYLCLCVELCELSVVWTYLDFYPCAALIWFKRSCCCCWCCALIFFFFVSEPFLFAASSSVLDDTCCSVATGFGLNSTRARTNPNCRSPPPSRYR